MLPALYVLCSSESRREAWQARAPFHVDLDVIPLAPVRSAIGTIHELASQREQPFLVARDSVWIGLGMGLQVERLTQELDARFSNWAACGNRGVRWDEQLLDFGQDTRMGALRTSLAAHTVISLDDNLLLLNPAVLRSHMAPVPTVPSLNAGLPLSLECLANGSIMAVSPRLMSMRAGLETEAAWRDLEGDQAFRRYYRTHFVNDEFPAPDGDLRLGDVVDFSYLSDTGDNAQPAGKLELYDRALAGARRKPSLTICCRTQFQRPEMLERALLSFSVARGYASFLGDLQIRLITDRSEAESQAETSRLKALYPAAQLECWRRSVREPRLSRIDLLIAAIERCDTDYIWFIDDDDYILPPAVAALARCLIPDSSVMVIAAAPRMKETWESAATTEGDSPLAGPKRRLGAVERYEGYPARGIFSVLHGDNRVPICGVVFPVKLMQERLRHRAALGEYLEDYFLLLLALTAPRVEVSVLEMEVAAFSMRGQENTTGEQDRSKWYQSYATFLLEVLNNEDGNSPFLWQQGNAAVWDLL